MLIGNTLYDIRTSAKKEPLTMDNILQQVGYCLLNVVGEDGRVIGNDRYEITELCWYYSRQQVLISHPLTDFIQSKTALLKAASKLLQSCCTMTVQ